MDDRVSMVDEKTIKKVKREKKNQSVSRSVNGCLASENCIQVDEEKNSKAEHSFHLFCARSCKQTNKQTNNNNKQSQKMNKIVSIIWAVFGDL